MPKNIAGVFILRQENRFTRDTPAEKSHGSDWENPCGTLSVDSISLDRPTQTISINAVDVGDSNPTFEYSVDRTNWQSSNQFSSLPAGVYNVFVRNTNTGCEVNVEFVVIACDLTVDNVSTYDEHYDLTNGWIEITVSSVSNDIEWSFNGGNWVSGGYTMRWENLNEGQYTIDIRDEYGCTASHTLTLQNVPDVEDPTPPTELAATDDPDGEGLTLTWTKSIDEQTWVDHYRVYRSTSQGFTPDSGDLIKDNWNGGINTTDTPSEWQDPQYNDRNVNHGTTYYYRISAVDARGNESLYSDEFAYHFTDDVAPQPPSGIQATSGDEEIVVSWNASTTPDVDRYRIYHDWGEGMVLAAEINASNLQYTIPNLTNGAVYHVAVRSVDEADNWSAFSDSDSAIPADVTAPATPSVSVANSPGTEELIINVSTGDPTDVVGYKIYKADETGGPFTHIHTINTSSANASWVDTDVVFDEDYFYRASAIDEVPNESGLSNESSGTPVDQIWISQDWNYRQEIVIQSSEIPSDQTDIPVRIDMSEMAPGFFYHVNEDGSDIRVTTDDKTTQVPVEVVWVDTTNETGEIYFKAPNLSSSQNTSFYVYYGNDAVTIPSPSSAIGRNNVWPNDFVGVWNPKGLELPNKIVDSTGNGHNGWLMDRYGSYLTLNGSIGNRVDIDTFKYEGTYAELTVEFWFRTTSTQEPTILSFDRNEYWRIQIGGDASSYSNRIGACFFTDAGQIDYFDTSNVDVTDGNWHHVAFVYDNGSCSLYLDGNLESTGGTGSVIGSGNPRYGFIGAGSESSVYGDGSVGGGNNYDGDISEVRVWNIARTESEILDGMMGRLSGSEQGLDIYLPCNDGDGSLIDTPMSSGPQGHIQGDVVWNEKIFDPNSKGFDGSSKIVVPHHPDFDITEEIHFDVLTDIDYLPDQMQSDFPYLIAQSNETYRYGVYQSGTDRMGIRMNYQDPDEIQFDYPMVSVGKIHLVGQYDRSISEMFEQGTSQATEVSSSQINLGDSPLSFAGGWEGHIYRLVLGTEVKSDDEILTRNNNFVNSSSFILSQAEEVRDGAPPEVPRISVTDEADTQITLEIRRHTGALASKYHIYRASTSGGPYTLQHTIDGPNEVESWADTNVTEGSTYFYIATIENAVGTEGGYSNEVRGDAISYVTIADHIFTNAGATGNTGPTQSHVDSEYANTELDGEVTIVESGIQKWVAPESGIYLIELWGAEGGGSLGGNGGYTKGEIILNQGDEVYIRVGQRGLDAGSTYPQGGWPNGGHGTQDNGEGNGGGGESSVSINSTNLTDRILVAGGGGGSGGCGDGAQGGHGGGNTGTNGGTRDSGHAGGGGGGTQSSGGLSGYNRTGEGSYSPGEDGAFGEGGDASDQSDQCGTGGGGGGWYGGGGASSDQHGSGWGAAGGGGSGYVDDSSVDNGETLQNQNSGHGKVVIGSVI